MYQNINQFHFWHKTLKIDYSELFISLLSMISSYKMLMLRKQLKALIVG